ncbi:MAG: hypothetical protein JXR15_13610 [Shimia sp.]|uniref:hypothetical protein n=1 Tax=Shimia sp. TaxID=1954381 RepID=UPI003B8E0F88
MTRKPRLALIHATRVAIDPIESAAQKLWPEAETVTILEEGLSADRQNDAELSLDLWDRIIGLARYAEDIRADAILFTCSAFGRAIEDAADGAKVPVLKPNQAMFTEALAIGTRVAMIYTFPPAAEGMEEEFRETAKASGSDAQVRSYFCEGALAAKHTGDDAKHDALIAATAASIADADVILLAQFSMADAAGLAREKTNIPILSSPDSAILAIKERLQQQEKDIAC